MAKSGSTNKLVTKGPNQQAGTGRAYYLPSDDCTNEVHGAATAS